MLPLNQEREVSCMTDAQVWKLFSQNHGVASRKEVTDAGLTNRQIRRRRETGEWVEIEPDVFRHAAAPVKWEGSARAVALSVGGLVSHQAAARLHQLDGFTQPKIHVVVAEGQYRVRSTATVHRSKHMHLAGATFRHGVPVTGMARTLLDVAGQISGRRLNHAVDSALRQKRVTWQMLYSVLVRHSARGRNGCGPLRQLLEERFGDCAIPDSRWNRDVAYLLTDAGLPGPEFEWEVRTNGVLVARVDLAYPDVELAIECDSVRWHANSVSFVNDPRRRNRLLNAGWRVLSFTWDDYANRPAQIVKDVRDALQLSARVR